MLCLSSFQLYQSYVRDLVMPISCLGSGNMKRRPAAASAAGCDGAVLFKFERDSSPLDAVL